MVYSTQSVERLAGRRFVHVRDELKKKKRRRRRVEAKMGDDENIYLTKKKKKLGAKANEGNWG